MRKFGRIISSSKYGTLDTTTEMHAGFIQRMYPELRQFLPE